MTTTDLTLELATCRDLIVELCNRPDVRCVILLDGDHELQVMLKGVDLDRAKRLMAMGVEFVEIVEGT